MGKFEMSKNFLRNHIKSEFAQIPNELIEDRTISATARMLFCYLAVKPDNWNFFISDISNALRISPDTLRKVIKELVFAGWILDEGQDRKRGQFGSKIISIFAFKIPKIEENRVGKFPKRQKTESEKNRVGNIQIHNNKNSKKYFKTKNTSSSSSSSSLPPQPEEEEEEEGVVPYSAIPDEGMDGLSRDAIVAGIEELAASNAGDFETYRDSLIREVLSGRGRTIVNIRKNIQKQHGRLPAGVNIFDIIGRDK